MDAQSARPAAFVAEGLNASTLVVSLLRDGTVTYPRGDTVIAAGDSLTILTAKRQEETVRRFLEA